MLGGDAAALRDVMVHGRHLAHVAAAVGECYCSDELRERVHRELGVERQVKGLCQPLSSPALAMVRCLFAIKHEMELVEAAHLQSIFVIPVV